MDGKKENERSVEAFIIEIKYHQGNSKAPNTG